MGAMPNHALLRRSLTGAVGQAASFLSSPKPPRPQPASQRRGAGCQAVAYHRLLPGGRHTQGSPGQGTSSRWRQAARRCRQRRRRDVAPRAAAMDAGALGKPEGRHQADKVRCCAAATESTACIVGAGVRNLVLSRGSPPQPACGAACCTLCGGFHCTAALAKLTSG